MEEKQRVGQFSKSHMVAAEDNVELKNEDNIFERGFLDSMFALQLVNFIEEEFGVQVTDEDLDIQNFSSIDRILSFISKKKEAVHD